MKAKMLYLVFLCQYSYSYSQNLPKLWVLEHPQMGTVFRIKVYSDDSVLVSNAVKKAFLKLDTLNMILSDYRSDSEINRLSSLAFNNPVGVSEDLWNILEISRKAFFQSNGNFDVSLGPLSKVWRRSFRQGTLPDSVPLQEAKSRSGFEKLILENRKLTFLKANMQLDFGGIGKGYALDKMMEILKNEGLEYVLIETGSSILTANYPIKNQGWPIVLNGIQVALKYQATSTSGASFQNVRINNTIYGHILDPKTGLGINHLQEISVVGNTAAEADWQSTAMCIMTKKELRRFAKKYKIRYYMKSDTTK